MSDQHWHSLSVSGDLRRVRARRSSHYLTMRDGVRIAIDLHLPEGAAGRVPAIVRQTRYLRSLEARTFLPITEAFDLYARTRRVFLRAGYAWVDVDVRGSGASGGVQAHPWSKDEVKDGGEVVSWIVAQPWSSGKVGSLGISYDGTCADMLLVNQHPAVAAIAPLFSSWDVFADVAFPGGIYLAWFVEAWSRYNAALDRGAFPEAFTTPIRLIARAAHASPSPRGGDRLVALLGGVDRARFDPAVAAILGRLVAGVTPVEGDAGRAELARSVAAHAGNFDVHEGAQGLTFRDDRGLAPLVPEEDIDDMSPHAHAAALRGSGAAIYSYSGWRDGAYPNSAIKRHAAVPSPGGRLTIGPWVHTGKLRVRPFDVAVPAGFDHDDELLGFFDEHLRGLPAAGDGQPVHYFTLVEERWKSCASWPPPATAEILYLAGGRALATGAPEADSGDDAHLIDPSLGTGERSRWRSLLSLVPGDYPDRRDRDRGLLVYDGAPLDRAMEVTGHPVVSLFVSWDDDGDGRIFAYLEDVAPDGRVAYVTEGQLRALHRRTRGSRAVGGIPERSFRRGDAWPLPAGEVGELSFELLPISWRFERGHRVRLAIAGADADHFARATRGSTLRVHRSRRFPSRVELPVVR
jgi:uncharacterized protein